MIRGLRIGHCLEQNIILFGLKSGFVGIIHKVPQNPPEIS